MSTAPLERGPAVDGHAIEMVRVALLVRQVALGAAVLATMVGSSSAPALLAVGALLVTSQVGLHSVRVLRLVQRHPTLALVDVILVATAMLLLGPRHPVVLAALTSALVVGVLFRRSVSPLLVVVLLSGHLLSLRDMTAPTFDDLVGTPVVIVSVAAIGLAFRRLVERAQETEREAADARQAVATAEERLRLARDVHDTVAKSVQGVALLAATLPVWIDRDSTRAAAHAALVASSARDAVDEARTLLTGLRTVRGEERVEQWLSARVQTWREDRQAPVTLTMAPVPVLEAMVCHELLAATDEALENVDRHAPAAAVEVDLRLDDGCVVLTVRDDGPGFDAARRVRAVAEDHYGLVGIGERLASVGGSGTVTSVVGQGTTVHLVVPVPVGRSGATAAHAPTLRVVS